MLRRIARRVARAGLARPRLRSVVEAELKARRAATAPAVTPLAADVFVDGFGIHHPLDPAHRDRLKPAWRSMLDPVAVAEPPSDTGLRDRAGRAERVVAEASALVATTAGERLGSRILEVGCYDGAVAYQLSKLDGATVVASDLARYYVVQRPGQPAEADVEAQQGVLATLRERARVVAGAATGSVEFIEDDITASRLEDGSFDAIISFEVLEHVVDPQAAFRTMRRLLRPGGVGYHDYNPFFSLNGGHSLCTLDFAWGHARLDPTDFERYVEELRPDAVAQTLRFYRESLNRMTQADMRAAIAAAGLEPLAIVPWVDRAVLGRLGPEVLDEVRRTYPAAAIADLLATFVAVVVRRPG